jgi:nitrite reductase/ring-hydroxylating ferredoxin subunit
MDADNRAFALAGTLEELKAKGRLVVHGRHRPILVVYDRGRVFALDNRCPHMGFPLERGSVEDGILTCHWHHARFDLESGCTFDLWADDAPTCPVEARNGEIWVKTTFGHADPAAHWQQRLTDGLAHDLGLMIAKSVHGQLAADVPPAGIVRQVALFGAQNRDGWGVGLTILTALANLLPTCRRRKFTSPCSTARVAWRRTATDRRRDGNVRRLQVDRIRPLSNAGCGVGQMCAIARRPNVPCSRQLRPVSRRLGSLMPC